MKRRRLLDAVKAAVATRPARPRNWYDRLAEEDRRELEAIKKAWAEGEICSSASSLAKDIVAQCREMGIKTSGPDGVERWLRKA